MHNKLILTEFACLIFFLVCGQFLAEDCQQSELTQCIEQYIEPILQNASLGFATTAEHIDIACRLLNQGMECADRFALRCLQDSQRIIFRENMAAVQEATMRELCVDGAYRKEYLQHANCFHRIAPQHQECGAVFRTLVTSVNQNRNTNTQEKLSQMCGELDRFLDCVYNLTIRQCGTENGTSAAKFLRAYTEKIVGARIMSTCRKSSAGDQLTNSSNRIVAIDEEDELRAVSTDDLTSVISGTTTATSSTKRASRGPGGKSSSRRPGQRKPTTMPSRLATATTGSVDATTAPGAETTPHAAAVQTDTSG